RRRRSRRDDAGCYHARQRALDCPNQSTNDVRFRPLLTCSIAVCDNDGGGAPEAVVIPPCNSAYTRRSKCEFPLAEIARLLALRHQASARCGDVRQLAVEKKRQLDARIRTMTTMSRALDRLIADCVAPRRSADRCPILSALGQADRVR